MARYMRQVAEKYAAKETKTPSLPKLKDVRLALNVAECDAQPLVVAFGDTAALTDIDVRLAKAAFSDSLRGRFVFATSSDVAELERIGLNNAGGDLSSGIYVIDPDQFGLKGTQLARLPLESNLDEIVEGLGAVAATQKIEEKSRQQHVRAGKRQNAKWESETPVTDPRSLKTMEKARSRQRRPQR